MSQVDRRPTVARNFIAGDRRSVEWAMEQWLQMRPPVDQVRLTGDGPSVAATALGLHDLGKLRGLAGSPFQIDVELPASPRGAGDTLQALATATEAGIVESADVGRGDLVLMVDAHELDRGARRVAESAVDRAECGAVAVLPTRGMVPRAWREGPRADRVGVVPVDLMSPGLSPLWESAVEDRGMSRIVVCGHGVRLFGAVVAAGDFFLERLRDIPGHDEQRAILASRVALLRHGTQLPRTWRTPEAIWHHACGAAGATVTTSAASTTTRGVVVMPARSQRRAA